MGANRTISNYRRKKKKKKIVTRVDWSGLHQDLIRCFAEKIVSMKDFFAFRGVDKTWRSEAIKENSNASLRLQHKVPILLLPKHIYAPIRNIHSLTKGHIYQLDLPETSGKFCYSSSGWLLTIPQYSSELNLFNPLTHAHIELPPLSKTMFSPSSVKKFVLSSSPSWTSNYGVLLLSSNYSNLSLAIYKPGGTWIGISPKEPCTLRDALYYKGQFYVVNCFGRVFVCEIQDPNNAQLRLVAPQIGNEQFFGLGGLFKLPYLVESATGALLLVFFVHDLNRDSTVGCRVFEVPLENGKSWTESEVKNLGNRTLFLGANNSSFSIEALDDSICRANCIYFFNRSHVFTTGVDIGIYSMEDGKIDRHLETILPDLKYKDNVLTSHSWLQPNF